MRNIISALLICISSWAWAQDAKPIELAPDAPDRHIVVPGDTLWGIASMFLKDPYRWPEIWRLNAEDIKNPHRIYPGQVVVLDRSGDQPRLVLGKVIKAEPRIYSEQERREISAIPQSVIEPFLSRPLVVEPGALQNAARIIAFPEGRISIGNGETAYATGLVGQAALWQVFRPGKSLRDPDRPDEVLGEEAIYLGTARLAREGEPATLSIVSATQEILKNDYVIPAPPVAIVNYVPHAPKHPVRGRILDLYGGVGEGGRLSIVSISRGSKDGLEIGHVLAIHRAGQQAMNRIDNKFETYRLPDERYGSLFVFRVFDRVAYGLVMDATRPVVAGDAVTTP